MLNRAKNVIFTNPTSVNLFRKKYLTPTLECMNFMKKQTPQIAKPDLVIVHACNVADIAMIPLCFLDGAVSTEMFNLTKFHWSEV